MVISPQATVRRLRRFASAGHSPRPEAAVSLTERESEIVRLLAEDATNVEIGAESFISPGTVKKHVGEHPAAGRGQEPGWDRNMGVPEPGVRIGRRLWWIDEQGWRRRPSAPAPPRRASPLRGQPCKPAVPRRAGGGSRNRLGLR
ncbi:LuxR C-terminal-related transcriptional regulator [Catenulispora subtropica]